MADPIKDLPANVNQENEAKCEYKRDHYILTKKETPSQKDFETIKLISNGAYG